MSRQHTRSSWGRKLLYCHCHVKQVEAHVVKYPERERDRFRFDATLGNRANPYQSRKNIFVVSKLVVTNTY